MTTNADPQGTPQAGRFLMQVFWPAFLMAAVGEGVVFSLVDPHELSVVGLHLADSREAAYTIGFFVLWALFSLSSALTWWLSNDAGGGPPAQADSRRASPGDRPGLRRSA